MNFQVSCGVRLVEVFFARAASFSSASARLPRRRYASYPACVAPSIEATKAVRHQVIEERLRLGTVQMDVNDGGDFAPRRALEDRRDIGMQERLSPIEPRQLREELLEQLQDHARRSRLSLTRAGRTHRATQITSIEYVDDSALQQGGT